MREDDRALIRVTDTGAGIPGDQIDRIFGMFARVKRADADGPMGLGIGLALARRLAEMHGGELSVASPGENAGSTFTLPVPCVVTFTTFAPRAETVPASCSVAPLATAAALPSNGLPAQLDLKNALRIDVPLGV